MYHSNHFTNHYYMVAHLPNAAFHFSFLHHEIFIQLDVTSQVNYFYDSLHGNNHISQERKDVSCDRCCSGRSERNPRSGDKKSWILRHEKSTPLLSLSLLTGLPSSERRVFNTLQLVNGLKITFKNHSGLGLFLKPYLHSEKVFK